MVLNMYRIQITYTYILYVNIIKANASSMFILQIVVQKLILIKTRCKYNLLYLFSIYIILVISH